MRLVRAKLCIIRNKVLFRKKYDKKYVLEKSTTKSTTKSYLYFSTFLWDLDFKSSIKYIFNFEFIVNRLEYIFIVLFWYFTNNFLYI